MRLNSVSSSDADTNYQELGQRQNLAYIPPSGYCPNCGACQHCGRRTSYWPWSWSRTNSTMTYYKADGTVSHTENLAV